MAKFEDLKGSADISSAKVLIIAWERADNVGDIPICSVKKDRISEKNVCRIALRTGLII